MIKRMLMLGVSLLGMELSARKYNSILAYSKSELWVSLVFDAFSWFTALLFFIISFLSISRLIVYYLSPRNKKSKEWFLFAFFLLLMIIIYKLIAIMIIFLAVVYAMMEINDKSKQRKRYKRREHP